MTQENDMYYLTILQQAFQQKDPVIALRDAFREIIAKGSEPEYHEAYQRFLDWISTGIDELQTDDPELWESISKQALTSIMSSIATDTFEGSDKAKNNFIKAIEANKQLRDVFRDILSSIELTKLPPHEFVLEKDSVEFARIVFPKGEKEARLYRVVSGTYTLSHASGRFLWEGRISTSQVIWSEVFPDEDYSMAADTDEVAVQTSMKVSLLDGEIVISLTPGLESATMKVTLNE
ncbi:hypothetical protein ACFL47_08295 [Candidatus Latescibacterota bacterium]